MKILGIPIQIVLIGLAGIFFITTLLSLTGKISLNQKNVFQKDQISGTINFNGLAPEESVINILAREFGQKDFLTVESRIVPIDGAIWSANNTKAGTAYVIQAVLVKNGQELNKSEQLIVTSPATGEVLTINSAVKQPENKNAAVSGKIDLNGYLPLGSFININVRKAGETKFEVGLKSLPVLDGTIWSWEGLAGTTYEIQAELLRRDGSAVGKSELLTVTAPAYNETLKLNSTTKSPMSNFVSISGAINFNGIAPIGSLISVSQRETGKGQFNVFASSVPAADGAVWIFNQAKSGVSYDVQAYVISNGNIIAQSQIITVSAPAVNEILTFNVQPTQPSGPPANSISIDCLGFNPSNSTWQARVSYNNNSYVKNAGQFWVTVGTSGQNSDAVNIVVPPKDPNNPQQGQSYQSGFVFNQGQTYYARWAYSLCANCSTFSAFSPALQFSCSPQPTNTPTPQPTATTVPPTNTPVPTSTPLPTNTPVLTNTPFPTFAPEPTDTPTIPPVPTNG